MLKILDVVKSLQNVIEAKSGLKFESFKSENESSEYYAHTFTLKGKKGLFRIAKKTPTKSGWFVTVWKRGVDRIVAPYAESDAIDFFVIALVDGDNVGQFIFSRRILIEKNIFSANGKEGKRAMRVYTPWDNPTSAQAKKTQQWQSQFFVDLSSLGSESIVKINDLYGV